MEFYLDDCAYSKELVHLLRQAGHSVRTPHSDSMTGQDDPVHLEHAVAHGCILITKNPHDFELLHEEWQRQGRTHPGILLVYQDNIRGKDMRPGDVVRAIGNLVTSEIPLANALHNLNHWR